MLRKLGSSRIILIIGSLCLCVLVLYHINIYYYNQNQFIESMILPDIEKILHQQRIEIEKEMVHYPYDVLSERNVSKLSDLIMEEGGNPLRSIIVSTWRSGSSFFGDFVSAHPASYYYYEPLLHLGIVQFRQPLLSREPLDTLHSLFGCDYTNIEKFLEYRNIDKWHRDEYNRYLKEQCSLNICKDPKFRTKFCRLFPFQVAKIVGLGLDLMNEFLEDKTLGIKIVYLVRDPRGILNSRKHLDWCKDTPNCLDSASLCSNLLSDYVTAIDFSNRFPGKFKVLRYEDLSKDPWRLGRQIYSFYGLYFHKDVSKFIDSHTKVSQDSPYSTFRNSNAVSFQWREKLTFDEVYEIQENCYEALKIWGYNLAFNSSHQKIFNPLEPLSTSSIDNFQ